MGGIMIKGIILLAFLIVSAAFSPVLANGYTEFRAVTRIHPRTVAGEGGTLISNCGGAGTGGCILTPPACAGVGYNVFWIPVSHPLYKTFLSLAMASKATGRLIELRGSGECNEPGGYEILDAADFRDPGI